MTRLREMLPWFLLLLIGLCSFLMDLTEPVTEPSHGQGYYALDGWHTQDCP